MCCYLPSHPQAYLFHPTFVFPAHAHEVVLHSLCFTCFHICCGLRVLTTFFTDYNYHFHFLYHSFSLCTFTLLHFDVLCMSSFLSSFDILYVSYILNGNAMFVFFLVSFDIVSFGTFLLSALLGVQVSHYHVQPEAAVNYMRSRDLSWNTQETGTRVITAIANPSLSCEFTFKIESTSRAIHSH